MKRKLLALIIAICAVMSVFAFAGCKDDGKTTGKNGNVKLDVRQIAFTATTDVMNLNDTTSVNDYLSALAENGEIEYVINNGFINSFYDTASKVIASTANSYEGYDWMFYIDFKTLEGDEAIYATDYQTANYGDKTFYLSSNGVEGTPCVDGHSYLFVYEYSNMTW